MSSESPKKEGWIDFTLPSGRKGRRMANPKGRHMQRASRLAAGDSEGIGYALAAVTCVVDEQGMTLEDILDMPMADSTALIKEASRPLADLDTEEEDRKKVEKAKKLWGKIKEETEAEYAASGS